MGLRMEAAVDEYRLEDIARDHPIGAGVFIPFAISRLAGGSDATEATLAVRLRDIDGPGETRRMLRLFWSAGSVLAEPAAMQDRTVTEWAACGVACAIVHLYARVTVRQVAAFGDRFDYWVDDGDREYGLEVSGTMTEDLDGRHRTKVRQLQENPYRVDGYVVAVAFTIREVVVSFHRFEGNSQ
jgi:hypothetical protein